MDCELLLLKNSVIFLSPLIMYKKEVHLECPLSIQLDQQECSHLGDSTCDLKKQVSMISIQVEVLHNSDFEDTTLSNGSPVIEVSEVPRGIIANCTDRNLQRGEAASPNQSHIQEFTSGSEPVGPLTDEAVSEAHSVCHRGNPAPIERGHVSVVGPTVEHLLPGGEGSSCPECHNASDHSSHVEEGSR